MGGPWRESDPPPGRGCRLESVGEPPRAAGAGELPKGVGRMRSPARAARSGLVTAAVVGAVAAVAAILAPGASARPVQQAAPAAGTHACLVMTGSGDAAFTRSFNPYTGSVLNGGFMKGAIYEPLVVATVAGGGHVYPWLAKSWKWSSGNKTLTLQISQERQVVGRQAADRRRRRLQPEGRQAGQGDGHHRPLPRRHEHRLDQAGRGANGVAITLKTPDSQFIAANLNLQFVVPQHIWSKVAKPATFKNPKPVGSGPFTEHHAADDAGHRATARTRATGRRARRRSRASSTRRRPRTTPRCCRSRAARSTGRTTSCRTSRPPTRPRTRRTTTPSTPRRRTRCR